MLKNKRMINTLLLLAGAIGFLFMGVNWHIGIFAWIAPIFLLMFTRKTKWIHFLFFFAAMSVVGALCQTANNIVHLLIIDLIQGVSFGLVFTVLFMLDKLLYRKSERFFYTLIFPVLITLLEFVSSFAVGTWGSIAHAQYEYKPLIQLSSITGIYGIWFLAAWFASVVYWFAENRKNNKLVNKAVLIFGSVFFVLMLYGEIRINLETPVKGTVNIAAVLSDTDIHQFAEQESELMQKAAEDPSTEVPDRIFSDSLTLKTMIERTETAINRGAQIIVWNEISLILNQSQKTDLMNKIKSVCKKHDVYVLSAFLEECTEENKKAFNNISVFISPEGEILWEYKKSFLQPTAEALIVNAGNYEMPVVQTEYGKIGGVICADLDMQNYIKQAGEKSVDILLVPSYDWAEITPLHPQMASVQATQFGMSIVRVNGKGISSFYDCKGKEIASINTFHTDKKIFIVDMPVSSVRTIYSSIGDLFIYLCLAFLLFAVVKRFQKYKTN